MRRCLLAIVSILHFGNSLNAQRTICAADACVPGPCISAGASSTAYTCSNNPLYSYFGNATVAWSPNITNTTTTPTLNLGPGVKNLKDAAGNPVLVGAIVAGSVYQVAFDNTNIRILSGPVIVPTTTNIQQSLPTICFDGNGAHTTAFTCSRSPSGADLSRGSTILFGFAGSTNGAAATVDVEGSGGAQISFSDGSAIPAGSLKGDGSGTTNYYLLTFDADNDIWIIVNPVGHTGPTCSSFKNGLCVAP